ALGDCILLPDLLSLHMVRSHMNSTIISYHPGEKYRSSPASFLHSRLIAAGHSVYWNAIFAQHDDPTFVFLSLLWHALYAWDEALEESRVISTESIENINPTRELHVIQAHLLQYAPLLNDFRKAVLFVRETPYPGLDNPSLYTPEFRECSNARMRTECGNLLSGIQRLEEYRMMQSQRLRNIMNLGISSVNLQDMWRMQELAEATVKDSAGNPAFILLSHLSFHSFRSYKQ
ncbi:hypothetical protein H0H87_004887, partial [Tephrocybe sp. NHM501043]